MRKGNGDHVNVINLIHKDCYTFPYALKYTYHCILLCGVKNGSWGASRELDIFWLYILFVYNLVIWLLGYCSCLSCVYNFPIICMYDQVLKKSKTFSFIFQKIFVAILLENPPHNLTRSLGKLRSLSDLLHTLNTMVI